MNDLVATDIHGPERILAKEASPTLPGRNHSHPLFCHSHRERAGRLATDALADQSRKSEEKEGFVGRDRKNLIILTRDDVDVIATQNNELADLLQNIRL